MNYKEFFALAKKKNIENIQITEKTSVGSSFELINGNLESFNDSNICNYSIKAEVKGKTVKASTDYLSEEVLDDLIISAVNTDSSYEDEYLNNIENVNKEKTPDFNISNELKILKECSELRNKYSQIEKLSINFSESYINTRIINSKSVDISTSSHLCKLNVDAVSQENGSFTSFNQDILEKDKNKIDYTGFVENVLQKTIILTKKERIASGKYDLVIDSAVAACIISKLAIMVSADKIREKTSCLETKINKKVFSNKLTIIEDPCNKEYPGYRLFDDEGTNTCRKTIVSKGVIRTELTNIKEAKIKNINSTGNAYNGINTRNMFVMPGEKNLEQLLEVLKDGIYITDYMGEVETSINTLTGNISLQVFGFKVKDGKIISGIEPCIMTTSIFELLSNIKEIGSDLKFIMTSTASPSLLIEGISLAR